MTSKELLLCAKAQGAPLIDGKTVTFLWQGEKEPHLIGDYTNWEHVYPAGHNYTAWRNDLWRGLEYLFGR